MEPVNIEVGNGPVTKAGIYAQIAGALVGLSAFITTLTGNLPQGISPTVGVVLTAIGGASVTLAHIVTAVSRTNFAKAKAQVMAGQNAYPTLQEGIVEYDGPVDPDPEEPTDTNVDPPVEP